MTDPIDNVEWVDRDSLKPNDYNPNHVAKPELKLLAVSILEDGWTQPIVALDDGTIVDGYHRYLVSGENKQIVKKYAGKVPVVRVKVDDVHRKMSTVRHNRARGTHGILPMSAIVKGMLDDGCSREDVMRRMGMEREEIDRLVDRAGMPDKIGRNRTELGKAWRPKADEQDESEGK